MRHSIPSTRPSGASGLPLPGVNENLQTGEPDRVTPALSVYLDALRLLAALMAMLSFGPQKYLDPQFPLIWPAVLTAQIAVIAVFVGVLFRQGQRSV